MFVVKDKEHPRFRRADTGVGVDLVYRARVSLARALTGCTVEVRTLDDRIIHVPINDIIK